MKIAHVCLSLGKGGAEKLLVDNLPFYVAQGHQITIVQLSSALQEPSYIDTVEKAGIRIISLSKGSFTNPLIFFRLLKLMRKKQFDIFHVHLFPCLYYVSIASSLLRSSPALVFTEHCNFNRRLNKKFLQPVETFIYSKYDAIIAISKNVETVLKQWLPGLKNKITVINNGVNIDRFKSEVPYDDDYFEENFGLKKTDIKLLVASRFNPQKDQETIMRAVTYLDENFHLFLAGDGSGLADAEALAKNLDQHDRIHFLGFRTDIPKLMKSADINLLSSFYEGFSGVTLEALAAGKPFLGSDVAGINDVVPNSGFLFTMQQSKEAAEKINKIAGDENLKRKMMAEASLHIKQFDIKNMINQHLQLYHELMRKKMR